MKNIFISAVTGEFRGLRERIARHLHGRGYNLVYQECLKQETLDEEQLLDKLRTSVTQCEYAIFVVGHAGGELAKQEEYRKHSDLLPDDWASNATYTQWEFFIEKKCERQKFKLFFSSDQPAPAEFLNADLQHQFRDWIKKKSIYRTDFATIEELIISLLDEREDLFPRERPPAPTKLLPKVLGSRCVGRRTLLSNIDKAYWDCLEQGHMAFRAWVTGPPGIGKSQVAIEYAATFGDQFSAVFMIEGYDRETMEQQFADLLQSIDIPFMETTTTNVPLRKRKLIEWLNSSMSWLLVIDGVDSIDGANHVRDLIKDLRGGFVLVTGQRNEFLEEFSPFEIEQLEDSDGCKLILSNTKGRRHEKESDSHDALTLANMCNGFPIVLQHVTQVICRNGYSISEFIDRVENNHNNLVPIDVYAESFDALPLHCQVMLHLLANMGTGVLSRQIFEISGFAENFVYAIGVIFPKSAIGEVPDDIVNNIRFELQNSSWLGFDSKTGSFKIHQLLQEFVRQKLPFETNDELISICGYILESAIPEDVLLDSPNLSTDVFNQLAALTSLAPHIIHVEKQLRNENQFVNLVRGREFVLNVLRTRDFEKKISALYDELDRLENSENAQYLEEYSILLDRLRKLKNEIIQMRKDYETANPEENQAESNGAKISIANDPLINDLVELEAMVLIRFLDKLSENGTTTKVKQTARDYLRLLGIDLDELLELHWPGAFSIEEIEYFWQSISVPSENELVDSLEFLMTAYAREERFDLAAAIRDAISHFKRLKGIAQ